MVRTLKNKSLAVVVVDISQTTAEEAWVRPVGAIAPKQITIQKQGVMQALPARSVLEPPALYKPHIVSLYLAEWQYKRMCALIRRENLGGADHVYRVKHVERGEIIIRDFVGIVLGRFAAGTEEFRSKLGSTTGLSGDSMHPLLSGWEIRLRGTLSYVKIGGGQLASYEDGLPVTTYIAACKKAPM